MPVVLTQQNMGILKGYPTIKGRMHHLKNSPQIHFNERDVTDLARDWELQIGDALMVQSSPQRTGAVGIITRVYEDYVYSSYTEEQQRNAWYFYVNRAYVLKMVFIPSDMNVDFPDKQLIISFFNMNHLFDFGSTGGEQVRANPLRILRWMYLPKFIRRVMYCTCQSKCYCRYGKLNVHSKECQATTPCLQHNGTDHSMAIQLCRVLKRVIVYPEVLSKTPCPQCQFPTCDEIHTCSVCIPSRFPFDACQFSGCKRKNHMGGETFFCSQCVTARYCSRACVEKDKSIHAAGCLNILSSQ